MKTAVFSANAHDRLFLDEANKQFKRELLYYTEGLHRTTAPFAAGCLAVCAFVNDKVDGPTLSILANGGTRLIPAETEACRNLFVALNQSKT